MTAPQSLQKCKNSMYLFGLFESWPGSCPARCDKFGLGSLPSHRDALQTNSPINGSFFDLPKSSLRCREGLLTQVFWLFFPEAGGNKQAFNERGTTS